MSGTAAALTPKGMSRKDAAERWGVSIDVVDELIKKGLIEARKYGHSQKRNRLRTIVIVASLDAYFEALEDA